MAAIKKITAFTNQGRTIYAVIQRETDGFLMNDADGTFSAAPADFFFALTEDGTLKGFYSGSEDRTVWNDGVYNFYIYHQLGGSPTIATDTPLGLETVEISNDIIVDSAISAAEIRAALGMASANMDTQFSAIPGAVATTAMTESYSTIGGTKTLAQGIYEIASHMEEKAIVDTVLTTKKVDGLTTAMTFTLDDPENPTSITRAT